jgi:anti-sigma factor RsiW
MSKTCERMRESMSAGLDDQLSDAEHRRLQAHLKACGECRHEMEVLQGVDRMLASAAMVSPEPGFVKRFQDRLSARRNRRQGLIGLVLLTALTVSLLLVAVGSLAASGLWAWQGSVVTAPKFLGPIVDTVAVLGRAAENGISLVLIIWRALSRVSSHPYFLSSASVTLLMAAAWVWIVGWRPRAYRPVQV